MLSDLRYALRSLRRSLGFSVVAVLTLGIGIGANTTVFSWMEGLVLNPFPSVSDPSRLVSVNTTEHGRTIDIMSYPTYLELAARTRTVEKLTAFRFQQLGLQQRTAGGPASPVWSVFATTDYFAVLGVRPSLGRTFLPSDGVEGAEPVVVLSNALWRHQFASDPATIGKVVRVNGHDATVIGVAAPNFAGALAGLGFELWVPLSSFDLLNDSPGSLKSPYSRWLTVFGRLRPGVSVAQASTELDVAGRRIAAEQPNAGGTSATARPFDGGAAPGILTPMFVALLGVSALVLLIVCANLANLMLGRAASRQRELGVRAALGASRGRIARQLLVECFTIAGAGALLGVALAVWGRDSLATLLPAADLPIIVHAPLDPRVMAFVIVLTVAATLLFGLVPALRASRPDLRSALTSGSAGAGISRSRLRGAFVVAQLALSLVAVVSAALFVRTLRALQQLDPGFHDPAHVLLIGTDFGFAGIHDSTKIRSTVDRLLERTAALPGVTAVAVASHVPMGLTGGDNWSVSVPGYTPAKDEHISAWATQVTPEYFRVMRIPILRGRALDSADASPASNRSIVVNETFAARYFPGRDPVGAPIALGLDGVPNATIVGVAQNVVRGFDAMSVLSAPAAPAFYSPYASRPTAALTLHIRTAGDPLAFVPAVRGVIADVMPSLPILAPETLAEHATAAFFLQRVGATVLTVLAAVVLVLSALGLYGVTAYAVTARTHEVGVRLALGATSWQVVSAFLRAGVTLIAIGLAIGTAATLAIGRLLASQMYGVGVHDPLSLSSTALLLTLVGLLATYIPARRASRVDPMIALRAD